MPAHAVSRQVGYSCNQLFDLVADVEHYPEFVPFWVAARVRRVNDQLYYTDQVIELKLIHLQFRTKTTLIRSRRIEVMTTEKPFRLMRICWDFEPSEDGGCTAHLAVELDFRSNTLSRLMGLVSHEMVTRLIDAFEGRARLIHGPSRVAAARFGAAPFKISENYPVSAGLPDNAVAE